MRILNEDSMNYSFYRQNTDSIQFTIFVMNWQSAVIVQLMISLTPFTVF